MLAILTAGILAASYPAQTATPDLPLLAGAVAAPDCGNVPVLSGASCVSAPFGDMDAVVQAYKADLGGKGWLELDGSHNRTLLVRRKSGGGCEAMQMLVVLDTRERATADSLGHLGFVTLTGDLCHAAAADQ